MAAVAQQIAIAPVAVKARAAKVSTAQPKAMQVFKEFKAYETFSFLPPLTDDEIAKQVEYCVGSGWTPCIEFDTQKDGLVDREHMHAMPGYQDGRYWTMWKLPMYGCRYAGEVLEEIAACKREYPNAFIRIIGFDSIRQTQCVSFLVQKPSGGGASPSRAQTARAPARQPARAPAARQVQSMAPPPPRPSSRPQQSYSPPPPAPAARQSYSPPPPAASYGGSSGGATDFLKELEKRKVAWQEYASIDTKRKQLEAEIQAQRQKMDSLMSQVRSLEAEESRIDQERAALSSRFPGVDPSEFEQVRRILNM